VVTGVFADAVVAKPGPGMERKGTFEDEVWPASLLDSPSGSGEAVRGMERTVDIDRTRTG
jgi:hypothetical protein